MRSFVFLTGLLVFISPGWSYAHSHPPKSGQQPHEQVPTVLRFAQGNLEAHTSWQVGPTTSELSALRIEWKSAKDLNPVEPPGHFEVSLWMHMSGHPKPHGSAPTELSRVKDAQGEVLVGVYLVSNMDFYMGGLWEIKVELTYSDGRMETQILPVDVPDEEGHQH